MRALAVSLLAVSSFLVTIAQAPADQSSASRKVVYSFERTIDENVAVDAQPSPPGWQQQADVQQKGTPRATQGESDALQPSAPVQSSGTIEVDVLREQNDGGIVVSVREHGNDAGAAPVTCAVYPNTSLTCDSQQNVKPEEYALLRFLGKGFVDPSHMDGQRRWHVAQSSGGVDSTADYQIISSTDGMLTVAETQTIGSNGKAGATIRSTIGYDFDRTLPTSIDERVVQTQQPGAQNAAPAVRTVLKLVSVTP